MSQHFDDPYQFNLFPLVDKVTQSFHILFTANVEENLSYSTQRLSGNMCLENILET